MSSPTDPSPRVALVSGGNRGIGLETARRLAKLGLRVVIGSRSADNAAEAIAELAREGLAIAAVTLDVADPASIERALAEIDERFGCLDVLVNNAGVYEDGSRKASEVTPELLESTFRINLFGPWALAAGAAKRMRRQRYGRIVNVSSGLGSLSSLETGSYPSYGVSKHALNAMSVVFAAELRADNVLVNAASPGWCRTRMGGGAAPRSVEQGADGLVWLATLPDDGPSGGLFEDRRPLAR